MDELTILQERIAHLERLAEELSDVAARQGREIERLSARVEHLMRREAERETAEGAAVILGDERPPHY